MATLDSSFESDLQEAILDDAEQRFEAEYGPKLIQTARENWETYASRHGYDIGHISDEAELSIERDDNSVAIRIEFPELTALFEWGVDPHTIDGNPYLHFYYERIDQWIKTESVDWGSETGGIPEARAIRNTLESVGGEL